MPNNNKVNREYCRLCRRTGNFIVCDLCGGCTKCTIQLTKCIYDFGELYECKQCKLHYTNKNVVSV